MSDSTNGLFDRRTMMKVFGASSLLGLSGSASAADGDQPQPHHQQRQDSKNTDEDPHQMFRRMPVIDIPVIDAYHDCNTVWFIHTDASTEKMAQRLTEMVNYPTLHVPKLDDIADIDELADIYVFKNGIDRSEAEPWGGGPFGYQIDILDSVPGEKEYTPLRHPNVVMWKEDAEPEVLKSVDQLMEAKQAGRLTIKPTDMVVTAPVVSWPDDPFEEAAHMGMGPSDMTGEMQEMKGMMANMQEMMKEMCDQQQGSGKSSSQSDTAGN